MAASIGAQKEAVTPVITPLGLFSEHSVYYLVLFLLQRFAKAPPFEGAELTLLKQNA